MNRVIRGGVVAVFGAMVLIAGGCASDKAGSADAAKAPSAAEAMFGQVKGLAGTWEAKDEKGQTQTTVYRVVSGGSAVCETMAMGTDYEMVNMYHLDGDRLMVTHYCAMGNQPRMAARTPKDASSILFEFDGITNVRSPHEMQMSSLELDMPDKDHLTQKWISTQDGKVTDHAVFALARRK